MPDYRESSRTFGDYPQVDITLQPLLILQIKSVTTAIDLNSRLRTDSSANIRSIDELQKVSDFIAKRSAEAGRGLTIPDPENPGRSLPAGNKTISGVMNALGMTIGEQQQFANAMFQLDAARRSSVNQKPNWYLPLT